MPVHERVNSKHRDLAHSFLSPIEWKSHRGASRLEFGAPTSLACEISGRQSKVQGIRDFTATFPSSVSP